MKKFILKLLSFLICLIFIFTISAGCKFESDTNTPITIKTYDTRLCSGCSIKSMSTSHSSSVSYLITPSGFDFDELNIQGYKMKISVYYTVKYKKNSNLPDFLYAGSPKYELTILTSDLIAYQERDLPTTTTEKTKLYSYYFDIVNLKNSKVALMFSTDNVQNIIYFSNIAIEYKCYK